MCIQVTERERTEDSLAVSVDGSGRSARGIATIYSNYTLSIFSVHAARTQLQCMLRTSSMHERSKASRRPEMQAACIKA